MAITESFLVNTDTFEDVVEALISKGDVPAKVNDELLKELGFSNPSDLLVLHILKGMNILQKDGAPTERYAMMVDPASSAQAIAEGIIDGYEDLIKRKPKAYALSVDELKEELDTIFEGKKTDLIIKYMSNTFLKLASYAGHQKLDEARIRILGEDDVAKDVIKSVSELHKNGTSDYNSISELHKEEKGSLDIDDVLSIDTVDEEDADETVAENPDNIQPEVNQEKTGEAEEAVPESDELTEEDAAADEDIFNFEEDEEVNLPDIQTESLNKNEKDNMKTLGKIPSNEKVQHAFLKRADLLYKLERYEEVLPAFNDIINHFDKAEEDFLREAVARSIVRRAVVLGKLKRNDELLPALDEVINRFSYSENPEYYEHASMAMLNKVELVEAKTSMSELMNLYETIIDRLGDSSKLIIKQRVDDIFLKRADILITNGDNEKALPAIDQLIQRFEGTGQAEDRLEEAMYKKAEILEELNRDEEALEAYSKFIERFGDMVEA